MSLASLKTKKSKKKWQDTQDQKQRFVENLANPY